MLVVARRLSDDVATLVAASATTVTFVLAILASIAAGPYRDGEMVLELDRSWVPALGVGFSSAWTASAPPSCPSPGSCGCWSACTASGCVRRPGGALFLAVVGGALATFTVMDAVLFFIAFELVSCRCGSRSPW